MSAAGSPLDVEGATEHLLFSDTALRMTQATGVGQELLGDEVAGRTCADALFARAARCEGCPHTSGGGRRHEVVRRAHGAQGRIAVSVVCHPPLRLGGVEDGVVPIVIRDTAAQEAWRKSLALRSREIAALTGLVRALGELPEPPGVEEKILAAVQVLIPDATGQVWGYEEAGAALRLQAAIGGGETAGAGRHALPVGEGLANLAAAARRTVSTDHMQGAPRCAGGRRAPGAEGVAGLAVPLGLRDPLDGVLVVTRQGAHGFSAEEHNLLEIFASQAAIALANRRHHEAGVRRDGELEALLQAARALLTGRSLQEILERLLAEAAKFSGTAHVKILLLDRDGKALHPAAVSGEPVPVGFSVAWGTSYSGTVAATGEPLFVADTQNDPRNLLRERDREAGIRTFLGLPIAYQGRVLGVLTFNTTSPHTYPLQRITYLRSFADLAALAIENARLYEALREHASALEARVEERTREIQATNRELKVASRHKSEFLANMSHELRTPLNSILGFGHILARTGEGSLTPKQRRHIHHIIDGGEHLLQLINDILDLSKVEAGRMELMVEPVELGPLLGGLAAVARGLGHPKGQTLEVAIDPALPAIRADAIRVKQICYNLLSNAVKFTGEGGTVTLTARPAAPDAAGPGPWVEIVVTDTGIGIDPEDLPRLFAAFIQLEPAATKGYGGTGLGLALTKHLVELHGGRVTAASPGKGQGSTFTVLLPIHGPMGQPAGVP